MQTIFSFLNMNKLFISKSSVYWKVISESKGGWRRISDIQKYLKAKFPWLRMIFLVLKHLNNMHIEFLCILEVAAGIMTKLHYKFMKAICTLVRIDCVNLRYATQLLIFLSNHNFDYHLDFALFINSGGRTWKTRWFQHSSHIFISISISCVCGLGLCAAFAKCQCWHAIYWGDWGTKTKKLTPSGRTGWVQLHLT